MLNLMGILLKVTLKDNYYVNTYKTKYIKQTVLTWLIFTGPVIHSAMHMQNTVYTLGM